MILRALCGGDVVGWIVSTVVGLALSPVLVLLILFWMH